MKAGGKNKRIRRAKKMLSVAKLACPFPSETTDIDLICHKAHRPKWYTMQGKKLKKKKNTSKESKLLSWITSVAALLTALTGLLNAIHHYLLP
jgi:hypothetical protein